MNIYQLMTVRHIVLFALTLFLGSPIQAKNFIGFRPFTALDSTLVFPPKKALNHKSLDSIKSLVATLNKEGISLRNNSKFTDALKVHFQAYQLADKVGYNAGKILALNNIGTDLRRTGSNIEATKYHLEALNIAKQDTLFLKSQAIASNGMGNIYITLKKPETAIHYFETALAIEKLLKSNLGKAINYANIGEAYRIQGDTGKALTFYNRSLQENISMKNPLGEAICFTAIGNVYLDLQDGARAEAYAKRALSKLSGLNDIYHQIQVDFTLCQAYIQLNKIKAASALIQKILLQAKQLNSFILIKKAYGLLVDVNRLKGDFNSALAAKEMEIKFNDSINQTTNAVKVLEIEERYKNKEAHQRINYLTKENQLANKTQKNQFLIFVLISLLLTVLLVFFYYANRKRREISEELRQVNEMKSRFFNNISHEFKTPLALIKGPVNQLLKKATNQEDKAFLKLIEKNSNILSGLVDKTLNLSRIEANKFEVYYQEGNLKALLNQMLLPFNYSAKEKNLGFESVLDDTGVVKLDKTIITLLINNLMSNAIKYTPRSGAIQVKGFCKQDFYRLCVKNTVRKTTLDVDKLFDRYYTDATETNKGTGIGLALVKELCKIYDSQVAVHYEPGSYIEFSIDFPLVCTEVTPTLQSEADALKEDTLVFETDSPILLIAEDNADMRMYFKSIFADQFNVVVAENGQEALRKALEFIPDVVISDVMMPVMDGLALCNKLKTNPNTNHIPILLLSAVTEQDIVLEAYNTQVDDYIVKPFTNDVLLTKVKNLIKIRKLLKEKYIKSITQEPDKVPFNTEDPFQKLLKHIVEDSLLNPEFDVEDFCQKTHMSRSQLHRKLTALFDMSATEFIRFHRLKKL